MRMRMADWGSRLGCAFLGLALSASGVAQDEEGKADAEPLKRFWWCQVGKDEVTFQFRPRGGSEATLEELMELVREVSQVRFLELSSFDLHQMRGARIEFEGKKVIPREKLLDFFHVYLKMHGFATVEMGTASAPLTKVVRIGGDGLQAILENVARVPFRDLHKYAERHSMIRTKIPLKHLSPSAVEAMLGRFFTRAQLEDFRASWISGRGLLASGFGSTLQAVVKLIRRLDQPPSPPPPGVPRSFVMFHCEVWRVRNLAWAARLDNPLDSGDPAAARRLVLAGKENAFLEAEFRAPLMLGERSELIHAWKGKWEERSVDGTSEITVLVDRYHPKLYRMELGLNVRFEKSISTATSTATLGAGGMHVFQCGGSKDSGMALVFAWVQPQ